MKKNSLFNKIIVLTVGVIGVLFLIIAINNSRLINGLTDSQNGEIEKGSEISPNYFEYSEKTLSDARKRGNVVLFFAATTWCNTCAALDKELKERSSDLPQGFTVLKVDYDNDKERRNQYGITTQHTLILEDREGKEIKRWIGGGFETLLSQII